MFMLISMLHMLVTIATVMLSIMGYQYVNEGYGLHPLICGAAIFFMAVALTAFSLMPSYKYVPAHPKG